MSLLLVALAACSFNEGAPVVSPEALDAAAEHEASAGGAAKPEAEATTPAPPTKMPAIPDPPQLAQVALGGRLYDNWVALQESFVPARSGRIGQGGPTDDGTLRDASGQRVMNDAGHNYRMVRFFGWDLQGARGVDGPGRRGVKSIRTESLLDPKLDAESLHALIHGGAPGLPAWGEVLDEAQIDAVVAFILAVRDGPMPNPRMIYANVPGADAPYILRPGGDPERGHRTIAARCAMCHGADGTALLLDDGALSLGTFGRTEAYEGWLKVAVGHPGSVMNSQLPGELDGPGHTTYVLDLFAALCDRGRYPKGPATDPDVPDDDPRCDRYLR